MVLSLVCYFNKFFGTSWKLQSRTCELEVFLLQWSRWSLSLSTNSHDFIHKVRSACYWGSMFACALNFALYQTTSGPSQFLTGKAESAPEEVPCWLPGLGGGLWRLSPGKKEKPFHPLLFVEFLFSLCRMFLLASAQCLKRCYEIQKKMGEDGWSSAYLQCRNDHY